MLVCPLRHALVQPRRLQVGMRAFRRETLAAVHRLRHFDRPPSGARPVCRLHHVHVAEQEKGRSWLAHSEGAISFGLVNIPVELFPAEERKGFQFSMLDKRDLSPVRYKRYSKKSGKEVEWANIVKGYEYEKTSTSSCGRGFSSAPTSRPSRTIDIKAFVPATEIHRSITRHLTTSLRPIPAKGLCAAARDLARDRACRRGASRHPDDGTPGGRRSSGTRVDAGHDAPCR